MTRRVTGLALVLAGAIALSACSSGDGSTAPKAATTTVGFRFAPSVPAGVRSRTGQLMQARLRELGVTGATVVVQRGRLLASGPGALRRVIDAVAARGVLEVRPVLALETAGPDGVQPDSPGVVLPSRSSPPAKLRFVVGPAAITGGVRHASPHFLSGGMGWSVDLSLTPSALRRFNYLAVAGVSKPPPQNQVAIVLDGIVLSAPTFVAAHFSGELEISSDFTRASARALAAVLNTGAYPVSVHRV